MDNILIPLLASMPPDKMKELLASLRQIDLPPDGVLFSEGEEGDSFYIVLEGAIDIVKALGTTEERVLKTMGRGEYFGEMCMLDLQRLRSASVSSRSGAKLLEMSSKDFNKLLKTFPEAAFDLAKVLSSRLRDTDNATINDLKEKNRQLKKAYRELQQAQAQIIEKEKLERELQLAWEIQNSMLPHSLPQFTGFDFGTRIVPARVVGGDFYDFIPLSDDSLGIAIGDVSGKGMPAAMFMAMTRSLMRAEARKAGSAQEALQGVNRLLLEMNESEMFVTVLYGVLNRKTGAFHYGRAGHELPILCNRQGTLVNPQRGHGQALGIIPDPAIDEQTIELSSGDTLLMFTDGATDAFDEKGAAFGLEGISRSLSHCCNDPPQQLCDDLTNLVLQFQHPIPQHDDVTIVAIRAGSDCRL